MDTTATSTPHRGATKTQVWDLPLRVFHWLLVIAVSAAGVTGFLAPEWWLDVHAYAGYAIGLLLAFRIAWGFVGSHFSRFATFPLSATNLVKHLKGLPKKTPQTDPGHNPAGAWMIVVLLTALVCLEISGLVTLGGQENLGPLASSVSFQTGHLVEEFHEILAWGLLIAIGGHLGGILVETFVLDHPVVKAMITGRRNRELTQSINTHWKRGLMVFSTTSAFLILGGLALANLPSSAIPKLSFPASYKTECGDCHDAYHPSLRTAETWKTMIDGLSNHYGEDASLDDETMTSIGTFLTTSSANKFDTEAAHRVGRKETPSMRMTDTKFWKKKHRKIAEPIFKQKTVGSKINCMACHGDALSGRFDDQNIQIPPGDIM